MVDILLIKERENLNKKEVTFDKVTSFFINLTVFHNKVKTIFIEKQLTKQDSSPILKSQ